MSKAKRVGIFIVVVCSLMGSTFAEDVPLGSYDGNDLLGYCRAYLKSESTGLSPNQAGMVSAAEGGVCVGYTLGVVATAQIWQVGAKRQGFCMPDEVWGQTEQIVRVVVKYLEDNPAKLHTSAAILVHYAIVEAFPCTESEQ